MEVSLTGTLNRCTLEENSPFINCNPSSNKVRPSCEGLAYFLTNQALKDWSVVQQLYACDPMTHQFVLRVLPINKQGESCFPAMTLSIAPVDALPKLCSKILGGTHRIG